MFVELFRCGPAQYQKKFVDVATDGIAQECSARRRPLDPDSSANTFIMRRSRAEPIPSDSNWGKQDTAQPNEEKAKPFKKNAVGEVALVTELVQHIAFEESYLTSTAYLEVVGVSHQQLFKGLSLFRTELVISSRSCSSDFLDPFLRNAQQGVSRVPGWVDQRVFSGETSTLGALLGRRVVAL